MRPAMEGLGGGCPEPSPAPRRPEDRSAARGADTFARNSCPSAGSAGALLRQVNEMVEAEAKRMAHALHDEAGQLLTAVHLKLADAARTVPTDCQSCFAEVRTLLDQIELQLRSLSHELNPAVLEQRGLAPAIQLLADGVACRTGIQVSVRSALTRRYALNVETAIYRAVQEALTNVSRHSQATRATIRLQEEGRRLHCVIRDNGVGFRPDAESAGMGLNGMRMRAEALGGRIKIRSTPGAGTELVVIVPAEQHETPA